MCGIAGVYNIVQGPRVDSEQIKQMIKVIEHRGPDGQGVYCEEQIGLGHRRLSIVDLAGGSQPMSNEDNSIVICYNGEVYNHAAFRSELEVKGHVFKTRSDTETLIHLYEEYGEKMVEKLNGMFAFVIWDKKKQKVLVVRDRLGVKPLYYAIHNNRFLFASEIKSILQVKDFSAKVNNQAILEYFTFYNALGDETFFKDVQLLEAGHLLTIQHGKIQKKKYWDLEDYEKYDLPEPKLIEDFQELLEDSVRIRLMSDVPVGSYLSGGIDSSTIAVIASKAYSGHYQTFSAGFKEGEAYDETQYAQMVADIIGAKHYKLMVDSDTFPSILPTLIWHLDEPRIGAAIFPQYYISKLASKHVKVCLGGQGCDEIFAGYARYFYGTLYRNLGSVFGKKISSMLRYSGGSKIKGNIQKQINSEILGWFFQNIKSLCLPYKKRYYGQFRMTSQDIQQSLFHTDFLNEVDCDSLYEKFLGVINNCPSKDPLDKLLYWDTKTYLNGLLMLEDRMSMANSLESRVPFLDYRIVEFSAKLPAAMKLNGLTTKYIVKKAVAKYLPEAILNKRKMGFPTPTGVWFKGEHQEWTRGILTSPRLQERGIFSGSFVSKLVNGYISDNRYWERIVWGILNVELWHRQFIDD